jgi:formylmethanofuran:tetrahydromethanopterin formyltransferase
MFQLFQQLTTAEWLTAIGTVGGLIWWMSQMYSESKASRVANQECVEVFKEVRGEVTEHRGRIISLEEWRAVQRSREEQE